MRAKTYDNQTAAFLAKLAECMPLLTATEMQGWIEKPSALKAALKSALSLPHVISLPGVMSGIWKAIELGIGPNDTAGFRAALLAAACSLSDAAKEIMNTPSFAIASSPVRLNLVAVTVADLGFVGRANYAHICSRGIDLGLRLCPAEAGPQLRLQYLNQPKGEWVYIAMEPIADSFENARGFTVAHTDEGLRLNSHGGIRGVRYDMDNLFAFVVPQ